MASGRYIHTLEELKARDNKLAELKAAIADVKTKLSQQKNLYEAVKTDRNLSALFLRQFFGGSGRESRQLYIWYL